MKDFPTVVANYFVEKGKKEGQPVEGILKIIKLVYIAHGWYLGLNENRLIRENVEAWKHGPVIRSVYDAFKEYSKRPILEPATTGISTEMKPIEELADNDGIIQFLEEIWDAYRDATGLQLSKLTHKEGTPWYKTWVEGKNQDSFGVVIEEVDIKNYYDGRDKEDQEAF